MQVFCHAAPRVGDSSIAQIIYEGVNALVQEGHNVPHGLEFPVRPDDSAVFARSEDGDEVAVICYRKHGPVCEVLLMYVEPSSRRSKVMTRLWKYFLEQMKTSRCTAITVGVTPLNEVADGFIRKLGGKVDAIHYMLDL